MGVIVEVCKVISFEVRNETRELGRGWMDLGKQQQPDSRLETTPLLRLLRLYDRLYDLANLRFLRSRRTSETGWGFSNLPTAAQATAATGEDRVESCDLVVMALIPTQPAALVASDSDTIGSSGRL